MRTPNIVIDERTAADSRAVVDTLHPYDEINPTHTVRASAQIAELVRYINIATLDSAHMALHRPGDVDQLVQNLVLAVQRLPQLLDQTAGRLDALREGNPYLYSSTASQDGISPQARVTQAAAELRSAKPLLSGLLTVLKAAGAQTSKIGVSAPEDYDDGVRYAGMDDD